MFAMPQWDKLHLKAWSWLRDDPLQKYVQLQGYVQFNVGCGLARYGNKVETIMGIHLQNLLSEIISKVFKNH
jgi:hypothetical protein